MTNPEHDYIELFIGSGVPQIAGEILAHLDFDALSKAECVCRLWRDTIRNEKIWKRFLRKLLRNPVMRELNDSVLCWGDGQPSDPAYHKNVIHALLCCHRKLTRNWLHGLYDTEQSSTFHTTGALVCFDANRDYVAIGQSNGKIIVRLKEEMGDVVPSDEAGYMEDDGFLAIYHQPNEKQHFELHADRSRCPILCMHLDERGILICGGLSGNIHVWNVQTRQLLTRFVGKEDGSIDHLRFGHGWLVTCSHVQGEREGAFLTLWRMESVREFTRIRETSFPSQSIEGLGFDKDFTVVLTKTESEFQIHVRSTQEPATLLHTISYQSRVFSGFHYENGHIAAGTEDGLIRIWNASTAKCCNILLRPNYDFGAIWLRFNANYLVTSNGVFMNVWNFKEAINPKLDPYTRLHCHCFYVQSGSRKEHWPFHMDDFEIVNYEPQMQFSNSLEPVADKGSILRRQFISRWNC